MPSLQEALKQKGLADNVLLSPPVKPWKSPLQVLRQGEHDQTVTTFREVLDDLSLTFNGSIQRNRKSFSWSDADNNRLKKVLDETCKSERADSCKKLYRLLTKRTELIAENLESGKTTATIAVQFPGRLRVGGQRGFRERLFPAFHSVYGVPYVPSSSIKGALLAWARDYLPEDEKQTVREMLGFLDGEEASLGKVQILDAFPTTPCLSVDVATPQWSWQGDRVEYGPSPHMMLSLKNVTLKVGLAHTSLGTTSDVKTVLKWLKDALVIKGLGSRLSAGYGRAKSDSTLNYPAKAEQRLLSNHPFSLWSQGIYGAQQSEHELRPTALRGILRYWFRAVGLGLYSPAECKRLEGELFGTIEPTPEQLQKKESPPQGSFYTALTADSSTVKKVVLTISKSKSRELNLYHDKATAIFGAATADHLNLLQHLFKLAIHCGGIGRGSRRALHINDQRFRGCHWENSHQNETLVWNPNAWQQFLNSLINAFLCAFPAVHRITRPTIVDNPGIGKPRYQDVLNKNAKILLVPCPKLVHPKLANWEEEGSSRNILGEALNMLYIRQDSGRFLYKGEKTIKVDGKKITEGNLSVGGKLGIPSYATIQSNFPLQAPAYQTVIVFGSAYHLDRQKFCHDLQQNSGAREVIWPD
ncbi:MAG: CRISPR-associated protein Cmr6 [Leptolyngbya foveolarum]|uniref:CRISPR-associated protein Cmr6 n=1 Tax=Leptolyngbya foveolarum TaxID=47253 RepID=A0A2W4TPQ7_9CYAN|nr:MAG: CRISPR-associated protein Cmr6 [Leptolyngbya foveolarum]